MQFDLNLQLNDVADAARLQLEVPHRHILVNFFGRHVTLVVVFLLPHPVLFSHQFLFFDRAFNGLITVTIITESFILLDENEELRQLRL